MGGKNPKAWRCCTGYNDGWSDRGLSCSDDNELWTRKIKTRLLFRVPSTWGPTQWGISSSFLSEWQERVDVSGRWGGIIIIFCEGEERGNWESRLGCSVGGEGNTGNFDSLGKRQGVPRGGEWAANSHTVWKSVGKAGDSDGRRLVTLVQTEINQMDAGFEYEFHTRNVLCFAVSFSFKELFFFLNDTEDAWTAKLSWDLKQTLFILNFSHSIMLFLREKKKDSYLEIFQ